MESARSNCSTETSPSFPGWPVVLACMVALMFGPSTLLVFNLGIYMGPIQSEFGWSRTEVALASTVVACTVMIASPLQGFLVDRYGARRVILPCIPLFAAGLSSLYLLPPDKTSYYIAWALLTLAGAGLFPLAYLRIVSSWFSKRLGLALGLTNAGVGLGGAIVPLITNYLFLEFGWRYGFMILGVIAFTVCMPVAYLFVKEPKEKALAFHQTRIETGIDFHAAIKETTFRSLVLTFFLLGFAGTALVVHQFPMLIDAGMTLQTATLVQTTYGIFVIIGRLLTGYLIDKFSPKRVMGIFTAGGALAAGLYATSTGGDTAFVSAALLGLLVGAEFDVLAYILTKEFGTKAFGRLYGLIFCTFQFGAVIGTAFLPIALQRTGSYSTGVWIFTIAFSIAALILISLASRTRIGPQVSATNTSA